MAGQLQHAQLPPFADILLAQFKSHAKAHVDAATTQVSFHLVPQRQIQTQRLDGYSEAGPHVFQPSTRHTLDEFPSLGTSLPFCCSSQLAGPAKLLVTSG